MGKCSLKYTPVTASLARFALPPSKPSGALLFVLCFFLPLYLRFVLKFTSVEIRKESPLIAAWKDFQEKNTRLILAFRHPYGDEPQLFSYVFDIALKRSARRAGMPFKVSPHARFVHGYEVALWGGALVRWLLPRIGAVPVYHVKTNTASIKRIRAIIREDECPLALAPEGQVSYRSETVPRLEQGTAQMGFWCAEELEKASRKERVVILPLSVHHRFDARDEKKLERLLDRLESWCGMDKFRKGSLTIKNRLIALETSILILCESFYTQTYGYKVVENSSVERQHRWNGLMEAALSHAEHGLGLISRDKTDAINRVYRIRQECWDRIYPDKGNPGVNESGKVRISELEAALDDRRAGEAWYAMRHMEFVDLIFYLDSGYLESSPAGKDEPSFNRIAETALNLADLVSRLAGGNINNRLNILRKKAVIIPGTLLDISTRLAEYKKDRKRAVEAATNDLKIAFEDCINEEYLDGKKG